MPNGKEMIGNMEFEKMIDKFSLPEQFLARELRDVKTELRDVKKECESRKTCYPPIHLDRKQLAIGAGGLTGLIAIFSVLIEVIKIAVRGG